MSLSAASVRSFRAGFALAACALAGVVMSGCSGGPNTPPPPQLQISCPASKSAESINGEPVPVAYGKATTTGGTAPVTVTCTPADGANFPVGTTNVTCTATDAKQAAASCGLTVTVTRVGTLSATRFMAFGDSITEGKPPSFCEAAPSGLSLRDAFLFDVQVLRRTVTPRAFETSYPNVLKGLLAARYASQSIVMFNEGLAGETIQDGGGTNDVMLDRLKSRMNADRPEVVLLQEGANDLVSFNHHPEAVELLIKPLRDMIREVRQRGARFVFLGTLLPEDAGGCRGSKGYDLVAPANDTIKAVAVSEGVVLVDLYQAFGGLQYIGIEDGLHPTVAGYEKMAQTFLDSIRGNLEQPR